MTKKRWRFGFALNLNAHFTHVLATIPALTAETPDAPQQCPELAAPEGSSRCTAV